MSLVGFVQCQNGEIQQKIFVRFGGFVVWGFTFRGLELYFSGFGALLFGVWDFTFCGLGLYFLWIRSGIRGLELIFGGEMVGK